MAGNSIPMLLVTANVGSIFEDPTQMLKIWTEEFLATVARLDPKFIALHCQEVGGKNYENSMKHVKDFVDLIMSSSELRLLDKVRVYLDEDYSSAEHFTALGNLYFIHESVQDVSIWNFKELQFESVEGVEINSGNIETVVTKEKAKFPQDFFPECKWSRKGFLRTRWSLNGTVIDLVNIHLFHDASNFVSMASYPSIYSQTREKALRHTLQRFHSDSHGSVPYFIFGDFNFRTDNQAVIKKLTEGLTPVRLQNSKKTEYTKVEYNNDDAQLVLTVGKKEFNHTNHQSIFSENDEFWLKEFDREPTAFSTTLCEFPVTFPPSYPYEERVEDGGRYMRTRCPAWCDRVLLSHTAKELLAVDREGGGDGDADQEGKRCNGVEYGLIGAERCMGDHKPVYFRTALRPHAGTLQCCQPHALYACSAGAVSRTTPPPPTVVACQCCRTFASVVSIRIVDMSDYMGDLNGRSYPDVRTIDSRLLHEPITRDMLTHEPYTPESADSHSPVFTSRRMLLGSSSSNGDSYLDNEGRRRGSVSPEQLKSKLTNLVIESLRNSHVNVSLLTAKAVGNSDSNSNHYDMCDESKTPSSELPIVTEPVKVRGNFTTNVEIPRISSSSSILTGSSLGQDSFRDRSKSDLSAVKCSNVIKLTEVVLRTRKIAGGTLLRDDNTGSSSQSLARLQSHHSSSDEDWFEFDIPQKRKTKDINLIVAVGESNDSTTETTSDIPKGGKSREVADDNILRKRKEISGNDSRRNCCCIL